MVSLPLHQYFEGHIFSRKSTTLLIAGDKIRGRVGSISVTYSGNPVLTFGPQYQPPRPISVVFFLSPSI